MSVQLYRGLFKGEWKTGALLSDDTILRLTSRFEVTNVGRESDWFDLDGRRIYEGDIVSLWVDDEYRYMEVCYGTVLRDLQCPWDREIIITCEICGWSFRWTDYHLFPVVTDSFSDIAFMKVVGNIHEHPELLERTHGRKYT